MEITVEEPIVERRLGGQVALVTGAGRGIGRAIAMRLARDGAFVIVHYRENDARANETLAAITRDGGRGVTLRADLRSLSEIDGMFARLDALIAEGGATALDILVNNAGIGVVKTIRETDGATFDDVVAVNARAPFFVARGAIPRLRDGGRIVNVSSISSQMGFPNLIAYSMTKSAVHAMSLALARELGVRGITVNSVAPGVIDTDMNADTLRDASSRAYMESLPVLGGIGTPEFVADAVAFLVSPDGAWVTGQQLNVSGGSSFG